MFADIVCVTDDVQDQIRCFSKKDASPDQIELPEVKPRQGIIYLHFSGIRGISDVMRSPQTGHPL